MVSITRFTRLPKPQHMKNLKTLLILLTLVSLCHLAYSQARRPTIMVVPSDNWCFRNNFVQEFDNQGTLIRVPDYRRAMQESTELLLVISKINELMADRGFPLVNLESSLRSLEMQSAEDAMLLSGGGAEVNESPIDRLKNVANADIWMQMTWSINQMGPNRSITFNLQGLDAYTDKQVAGASGTGQPSMSAELPILLEEAVIAHIDNFNSQLQRHFDDLFENGREINLRILTFSSFVGNLETEYWGVELNEIIEDWVADNTVRGRYSLTMATENRMSFEQVRIPLYNARGRAIDARAWARDLQRMLQQNFNIESKLMTRGLGQAQLVIGDR